MTTNPETVLHPSNPEYKFEMDEFDERLVPEEMIQQVKNSIDHVEGVIRSLTIDQLRLLAYGLFVAAGDDKVGTHIFCAPAKTKVAYLFQLMLAKLVLNPEAQMTDILLQYISKSYAEASRKPAPIVVGEI